MRNISTYLQEIWSNSFNSIDPKIVQEIYAFSFYVYNHEDDPRCPTLTIGYNTNSNLQKEIDEGSDRVEAKWNYAYWLQNEIAVVGDDDDKEGQSIIGNWISEMGLNYSDEEANEDDETCWQKGEKITAHFIELLIEIVSASHHNEMTTKPILIHELEYYDKISDQNIKANGAERVMEFTNWINSM